MSFSKRHISRHIKPAPLAPPGYYGFDLQLNGSITYYENPPPVRSLVFKGGGARGGVVYQEFLARISDTEFDIAQQGQVRVIKKDLLSTTETVYGTSAGSIAAAIYTAIPYPSAEARRRAMASFDMTAASDLWPEGTPWYKRFFYPDFLKKINNYRRMGAIYYGRKIERILREQIKRHTTNALFDFINRNRKSRFAILDHLIDIGLVRDYHVNLRTNSIDYLSLTDDITFEHFDILATQYPRSGFKKVVITGTRSDTGTCELFSGEDFPDMPIYKAVRTSIAIPGIFPKVPHNNVLYMDGGCSNNFPLLEAASKFDKKSTDWHEYYGDLSLLGIRVEYPKDKTNLLFGPRTPPSNIFSRAFNWLVRKITNWLVGMDVYTPDDNINKQVYDRFSQRIIQLSDSNIGLTEFDLGSRKKTSALKQAGIEISDHLTAHYGEKIRVNRFNNYSEMQPALLLRLTQDLSNRDIHSEDIFKSERDQPDLEKIRQREYGNAKKELLLQLKDSKLPDHVFFPNEDKRDKLKLKIKREGLIEQFSEEEKVIPKRLDRNNPRQIYGALRIIPAIRTPDNFIDLSELQLCSDIDRSPIATGDSYIHDSKNDLEAKHTHFTFS